MKIALIFVLYFLINPVLFGDLTCPRLALQYKIFQQERIEYEGRPGQISFSYNGKIPRYHIDNPGEDLPEKNAVWELDNVPLSELCRGNLIPIKYRSIGDFQEYWEVKQLVKTDTEIYFELVSPGGLRKYFQLNPSKDHLSAKEVESSATPLTAPPGYMPQKKITRQSFTDLDSSTKNTVVDFFVRILADASSTAQDSGTKKNAIQNIKSVVEDMVETFASRQPLTTKDWERWNSKINKNILEDEFAGEPPPSGIIRGSKKSITWQGKDVLIDTTNLQMSTFMSNDFIFHYIPAQKVPLRVFELLQKMETLDESSTFKDLAEIYKEFITIHPFVDGNGRTSRIVISWCMLKTGLIPTEVSEIPREALFSSLDELAISMEDNFLGTQYEYRMMQKIGKMNRKIGLK